MLRSIHRTGPRWLAWIATAHFAVTVLVVVVTANHYWIDGIGGLLTLGVGFLLARRITDWTVAWSNRSDTVTP